MDSFSFDCIQTVFGLKTSLKSKQNRLVFDAETTLHYMQRHALLPLEIE